MASNCHIGSLFFISGSKVAAVFPRGLFDEKSNISPPLIWLRVPMAKFVFVCVCIVFYLCISCLSMCNCICIWSVFVWFHHQASPAAHSPPLLTSRHLPAKLSAVRWQLAAPFTNERNPCVVLSRLAPHFQDEIVSLKKRPFLAGFQLFLVQLFCMWLIFICMTWIFCEKIVPSLLFPAAVRPQTFWYSPGRVATAYSTDKYKYKISWVGQSDRCI